MKKCLSCWEEIEESLKVCPHCGAEQEDVVEFLKLALLAQKRKPLSTESNTNIKNFLHKIDPKLTISKIETRKSESYPPSSDKYQEYVPTTLQQISTPVKGTETQKGKKTVMCPTCKKEVKLTKFCKYCGSPLFKECPQCKEKVSINVKFCPLCGHKFLEN
ncbi:MAG: zinc ribbon domain-containing protein [Candidatus Heimdallarchaeum endolithica]|uniref:Zinc ribbon domain-containing protein n=1 Tax=Candidatus Heimdallarchaeum endolithica TaxID=2876572 RepID=A0A9Y1BQQ6_9ARCH|nr:MAG: zinc ribbon domain-containing protein [Candidatus Heimdallarchaeum endolithica]